MRQKAGLTLLELLVSAAIFSGVLTASFAIFSVVNRMDRRNTSFSSAMYDGFSVVETLNQYARYATPFTDENGEIPTGCSNYPEQAVCSGIYVSDISAGDGRKLALNLRFLLEDGSVQYRLYRFELDNLNINGINEPFTVNGKQYELAKPKIEVDTVTAFKRGNGTWDIDINNPYLGSTTLIPDQLTALVPRAVGGIPNSGRTFLLTETQPATVSNLGTLKLDPVAISETGGRLLTGNIILVEIEQLKSYLNSPSVLKPLDMVTLPVSGATRTYEAQFTQ